MFLVSWFKAILEYFGVFQKKARILLVGLDNAGKTTLLHMLRDDKFVAHEPTRHPQNEHFRIGKTDISVHDMGGHVAARRIWTNYFASVDALVFVVDATDTNRIIEAKDELHRLVSDDMLKTIPFLILGNKIDLNNAISMCDLQESLDIRSLQHERMINIHMCSVKKRIGYMKGFEWLSSVM